MFLKSIIIWNKKYTGEYNIIKEYLEENCVMNAYELLMKIQQRMKDPNFAQRFNKIVNDLNTIPGLQQEVMRISQIEDERSRQKAIDKLPDKAKQSVKEFLTLLNG